MDNFYKVNIDLASLSELDNDISVVFHAMNKSGSLSLSNLLYGAFNIADRDSEFVSHFRMKITQDEYVSIINECNTKKFFIDHYLYGAIKPKPRRVLLTQFRHPMSRILSIYNWIKKHPLIYYPNSNVPNFIDFVNSTKGVSHSIVAQLGQNWLGLGTIDWYKKIQNLSSSELYERSLEALEREVYALGIAEFFEESVFLYAKLCGLCFLPKWVRDKRNEERALSTSLTAEEVEVLHHVYKFDFLLYEHALTRFWTQFKIGINNKELDMYKSLCSDQYKDRLIGTVEL